MTAFTLVFLAELLDKSQLMCLALAARFSPWTVLGGAALAFSVLNLLGVVAGATVASLLPVEWIQGAVGVVFLLFGVAGLVRGPGDEDEETVEGDTAGGYSPVLATAVVLGLSELGDKTQLTVAALASVEPPVVVWVGATAALMLTSGIAAFAGAWLLPRLPRNAIPRVAGASFVLVGLWVLYGAVFPG